MNANEFHIEAIIKTNRILVCLAALLLCPVTISQGQTPILEPILSDDFCGTATDSSKWHIPTFVSPTDGTFVGRTQFECTQNASLPTVSDCNANITVQTYNPTGTSFYGYDLISNETFTPGLGLTLTIVAKLGAATPAGTVSGLFLYGLKPDGTLHDEIDFELLSNDTTNFNTNIYGNEPLGVGHPVLYAYGSGSANDYHTYQIQWGTNQVVWSVDGTVVRTVTTESPIPTGPMYCHLNMWVPDGTYAQAYNPNLNYTTNPNDNQVYTTLVSGVEIQQLAIPILTTIDVSPTNLSLTVGATTNLVAITLDQGGNPFEATVSWSSDTIDVATVDPVTGFVTAIAPGNAIITASSEGVTNSVAVAVTTSNSPGIWFTAMPTYGHSGSAKGIVTHTNVFRDLEVLVYIKVQGNWWTKPYFDSPITKINPRGMWSAKIDTGGTDQNATEIRAYLVPSSLNVQNNAEADGVSDLPPILSDYPFADVIRLPAPTSLHKVTMVPNSLSLTPQDSSQQLTATGLTKGNQTVDVTFMWLSSNPEVAIVDQDGNVTPIATGSAKITATSGNVRGTVKVKVTLP